MLSINIQHGFSQYSSEELLDKASQGLLFCGETDLSSLIDKLFDAEVHTSYAVGYEEGFNQGFEAGKHEGQTFCWECLEEI